MSLLFCYFLLEIVTNCIQVFLIFYVQTTSFHWVVFLDFVNVRLKSVVHFYLYIGLFVEFLLSNNPLPLCVFRCSASGPRLRAWLSSTVLHSYSPVYPKTSQTSLSFTWYSSSVVFSLQGKENVKFQVESLLQSHENS